MDNSFKRYLKLIILTLTAFCEKNMHFIEWRLRANGSIAQVDWIKADYLQWICIEPNVILYSEWLLLNASGENPGCEKAISYIFFGEWLKEEISKKRSELKLSVFELKRKHCWSYDYVFSNSEFYFQFIASEWIYISFKRPISQMEFEIKEMIVIKVNVTQLKRLKIWYYQSTIQASLVAFILS